jgi:predicted kinase
VLVALSGLPGAGKSSIAHGLAVELGLCLIELDRIEAPVLRRVSGDLFAWAGYEILTSLAEDHLCLGHSTILDGVCWTRSIRTQWAELAQARNARLRPIEVVCDETLRRTRLTRRRRGDRGLPDVDWQRMEQARSMYESWDTPRLTLDSGGDLDDLVRRAVDYVRAA